MQQIAREKTYVVYTSFAEHGSVSYPTRSIFCDMLDEYTGPMDIDMFFQAFLAASLVNVQICREIGISPLGLFDIYVKIEFLAFQKCLCSLLPALYKRVRLHFTSSYAKDDVDQDLYLISRPRYAAQALPEYTRQAREIFFETYQLFANNQYYRKSYISHPKRGFDTPPEGELILFCFDEAGELFNGQDPRDTRLKALQEALREFAVKRSSNSKNKFFGVFIDRSAKISGFDPAQQHQRRKLTWTQPKLLHMLHPICEIDTTDIFAPNEEKTWKWIGTATKAVVSDREPNNLRYLYRLGRPL